MRLEYKFSFRWTSRTKLETFFCRAVGLYSRDTWMTGKTGTIIVLQEGLKVRAKNLCYFLFVNNNFVCPEFKWISPLNTNRWMLNQLRPFVQRSALHFLYRMILLDFVYISDEAQIFPSKSTLWPSLVDSYRQARFWINNQWLGFFAPENSQSFLSLRTPH